MSYPANHPLYPPGLQHPPSSGPHGTIPNVAGPYAHALPPVVPHATHAPPYPSPTQMPATGNGQPLSYSQAVGVSNGTAAVPALGQVYTATQGFSANSVGPTALPFVHGFAPNRPVQFGATNSSSTATHSLGMNVQAANPVVNAAAATSGSTPGSNTQVATYASAMAAQNTAARPVALANSVPPAPPAGNLSIGPTTASNPHPHALGNVAQSSRPCRVSVDDYLCRPDYLPTGALLGGSAWRQVGNFNWYSISGTDEKVVMTVVGKVSRNRLNVDPNGTYNGKHPLKKAKFALTLVVPDQSNPFHSHFQQAIAFLTQLQAAVGQSNDQRYLLVQDNGQVGLRLNQDMFAEREEPLNPHVPDLTVNWPMDPQFRPELLANAAQLEVKPLMAYDYSDILVPPERVKWALGGALVEATFTLRHCVVNDVALHDVFTGGLLQVRVLEEGTREVNPFRVNPGAGPVIGPVHGLVNGHLLPSMTAPVPVNTPAATTATVAGPGPQLAQLPPQSLYHHPSQTFPHVSAMNLSTAPAFPSHPSFNPMQQTPAGVFNPTLYYSQVPLLHTAPGLPMPVLAGPAQASAASNVAFDLPVSVSTPGGQSTGATTQPLSGPAEQKSALPSHAVDVHPPPVSRPDLHVEQQSAPATPQDVARSSHSSLLPAPASKSPSASEKGDGCSTPSKEVTVPLKGSANVPSASDVSTPAPRNSGTPWLATGYLPTPQTPSTWRPPSQLDIGARSLYPAQTSRVSGEELSAQGASQDVGASTTTTSTSLPSQPSSGDTVGLNAEGTQTPTGSLSLMPALPVRNISKANTGSLFHSNQFIDPPGSSIPTTPVGLSTTCPRGENGNVSGRSAESSITRVPTGPVEPQVDKAKGKGKGKRAADEAEDGEPPARRTRLMAATSG